jgi:Co/Zn/Cd efflux system component
MAKHDISTERFAVRGMRTSLLGMLANLGLALTKGVAGLFGHSFALVADGLESLADVVSGLVVYLASRSRLSLPIRTTRTATEKQNLSQRSSLESYW